MDNCSIVAHYDLKPPNVRIFDTSGNNLIIDEAFTDMIPGMSRSTLTFVKYS